MAISMNRVAYILGHSYGLNGCIGQSILFIGSPGGGKTTLAKEYAAKYCDGNRLTFEVSRMQGTDYAIPIPVHDERCFDYYPSRSVIKLANQAKGLMFFDEITRPSDSAALAAVINIFLEHDLADVDFKHITVWAAGNPAHQVGGQELDPAMANRLVIVEWPEDDGPEGFCDHVNAVDPKTGRRSGAEWPAAPENWQDRWDEHWDKAKNCVTSFLRVRSDLLNEECPTTFRAWRSKRSWHTCINVLAACTLHGATTTETLTLLGGTIGQEAAGAFMSWRAGYDLPDPKAVVANKVQLIDRDSMDMFIALSVACDYYISSHKKGVVLPPEDWTKCLLRCADVHMEAVAPIAGRLAKERIVYPCLTQLYQKVLPTK